MKKIVKQVLGIDVAKDELVVCLGRMHDDWTPELYMYKVFGNDRKGFSAMAAWAGKHSLGTVPVRYVMEATGVYHEGLAYFLRENGHGVSIVLPNKISSYARTLDIKTVTDRTASEAIARFGLERALDLWEKPRDTYKRMRQLTRERGQIVVERTMAKNQLHAEKVEAEPNKGSVKRIMERIKLLDKQELEIRAEVAGLIKKDPAVLAAMLLVCSLPGVGLMTGAVILAETNGFEMIRNRRQLTSFAGLDVVEKQSGTSVRGKARISKRGDRYLRKAMHMASIAAIKSDGRFRAVFERVVSKNGIKMKGVVAVQRKLLEMAYTIYKTGKKYDKDYLAVKARGKEEKPTALEAA